MLRFIPSPASYARRTDGGMTLLGLYLSVAMLMIGGLALDISNLIAARTELQAAADFAAHAALYQRQFIKDPDLAKAKALAMVKEVYPPAKYGEILKPEDLHFGYYDPATNGFKVDETSSFASVAFTGRNKANGNKVGAFLTQFIGYRNWNVATSSVFTTTRPHCLRDGWVAQDVVDAQSNNIFVDGYCIHSNTEVQFNSNSEFDWQDGVSVSSGAGRDGIVLPASGYTSNIGLDQAVVDWSVNYNLLPLFNHMEDLVYPGIFTKGSEYRRDYMPELFVSSGQFSQATVDAIKVPLPSKTMTTAQIEALKVTSGSNLFTATCSGPNAKLTIDASAEALHDVMIETNCKLVFTNASAVENATLWVRNSIDKSVTSAQDLRLGAKDGCAHGGGVNIYTTGGFEVPQGLTMFGSQVLAWGPIQFSAGPEGEGGSLISMSTIDGTSNGASWGACDNNGGEVWEFSQLRMAG